MEKFEQEESKVDTFCELCLLKVAFELYFSFLTIGIWTVTMVPLSLVP